MKTILLSCAAIGAFLPQAAFAQESAPPVGDTAEAASDDHYHPEVVVTAPGVGQLNLLAGTSVVDGTDLQRNMDNQIGEVLAKVPGVSASSFAPGVSRPVLRGFGGERVKVLTDGIGAIDASSTSDDHAVSVDPLIADRIEVLRGPAVLLYGSQAIGGAVNVITKRIPQRLPDESIHFDGLMAADSASNRREIGASIDMPLGEQIAFHIDGSRRRTDNLEIPGYAVSDALRADLLADAAEEEEEGHFDEAEELREGANQFGFVPNSATDTTTLGSGLAIFFGGNRVGASIDYFDTSYGIPGLPGAGHGHDEEGETEGDEEGEEGPVTIGMKRYQGGLTGQFALGGSAFETLNLSGKYSDYTHTEFEGDEIGTVFDVNGVETRLELVQTKRDGWQGSIGAQFGKTDFAAIGAEAFVPSNETQAYSLFALQQFDVGRVELELGGRVERTDIETDAALGLSRDFTGLSGAVGASTHLFGNQRLKVGFNASRTERAPSAQELFADGPHIATQQFELGDPTLDTERSVGVEGYVRGIMRGGIRLSASVYRNWFDDFIYLGATGAEEDGLDVFAYRQQSADQFGVEGEISASIYKRGGLDLVADLRGDYVRATLGGGSPVPRIPPYSLLAGMEAQMSKMDARLEVQHFGAQDRVSAFETPTDAFTIVNASIAFKPVAGAENLTIMGQIDNIFDVEGRRHSSFTKDFVPLPGRNVKVSVRMSL